MSLELVNISKNFGDKNVLTGFSYCFADKGIYVIEGPSGIGKTTLLRIIAGLDKDFSGSVVGGGANNVSYAFQEHRLFPHISAIENLLILAKKADFEIKTKAESLLTMLNFSQSDMKLLPDQLSGGMKQRVSFARAIIKDAPILLLDEPTKELDASLVQTVLNIIAEEGKKRTVILVTHDKIDSYISATTICL